jgi:ParB-like chromosome segregation protein Spo0J
MATITETASDRTVQPMPDLSAEQYAALRADITQNGVIVPIITDQHGRILDGNNRAAIAAELGIDCPREVRAVASDLEAVDIAITLNCARRHLTREQLREVVRAEIVRKPDDSDRAIARRVGCSPTTVGSIRNTQVSKLDSDRTIAEAEALTSSIRAHLNEMRDGLKYVCIEALSNKISAAEIVSSLTSSIRQMKKNNSDEYDVISNSVYGPLIDWLLEPTTSVQWRDQWDHPTFKPLTETEKTNILAELAGVF